LLQRLVHFGEAGMEALGNSQQFRAEKIADFTEKWLCQTEWS
jgi:hypothetical protein